MSPTPRRPRHAGRRGPPRARVPHIASAVDAHDPAAALRALVEAGIVAAAALNARDDLELAAASTQRLGTLTSGMWRALSRELATAAERLDRSTMERLDEIERRARALQVDAQEVIAVGVAAGHLAEHRERLETLVTAGQDAQRLLGVDLLFGFSLDAPLEDDDDPDAGPVDVALFFWPTPLTPATVSIVPSSLAGAAEGDLTVATSLLDALTAATELSDEQARHALTALAAACLAAHVLDEEALDDEDEEEGTDDDFEGERGPSGVDGV